MYLLSLIYCDYIVREWHYYRKFCDCVVIFLLHLNIVLLQILQRANKEVKQWVKLTDRAGNEFVTAKCIHAHSDLAKKHKIPVRHITGAARHNKG